MTKFRFWRHTGIGLPIAFVVTCIIVGGINKGAEILMMAVLCTAGVSLVVIIPICAMTGWVTENIYRSVRRALKGRSPSKDGEGGGESAAGPPEVPSQDCRAIAGYLRQAAAAGRGEVEAVEALVAAGWSRNGIREAQEYVERVRRVQT